MQYLHTCPPGTMKAIVFSLAYYWPSLALFWRVRTVEIAVVDIDSLFLPLLLISAGKMLLEYLNVLSSSSNSRNKLFMKPN